MLLMEQELGGKLNEVLQLRESKKDPTQITDQRWVCFALLSCNLHCFAQVCFCGTPEILLISKSPKVVGCGGFEHSDQKIKCLLLYH